MLSIYSIFDSKAEAYLLPFYCQNNAVAIRQFNSAGQNPQSAFALHPGDYTLFQIGTWDASTGALQMLDSKIPLGSALDLKELDGGDRQS